MAIVVNTNVDSLIAQKNLNAANTAMSNASTQLSTGLRINSAKDDAAGLFVGTTMNVQVQGSKQAKSNAQIGVNLMQKTEGDLTTIQSHVERIRDLTVQAANEIYDEDSMNAIKEEVDARIAEITRIANASEFNGKKLIGKDASGTLTFQVGANAEASTNAITVENIFVDSTATGLGIAADVATAFAPDADPATTAAYLDKLDEALTTLATRRSVIGAYQNRFESAIESLDVTVENLSSAYSTIMDADIASVSSEYVKQNILRQSGTSVLSRANQAPSLALSLIG